MTLLALLLVGWPAIFFLGMGIVGLLRPDRVVDRFGTVVNTVDGRNEIRSVYGGFGIAVALLLGWSLVTDGPGQRWIPIAIAVAIGGMALGRGVSMLLDRSRGSAVVWRYVLLEAAIVVSLLAAVCVR
ncbi:DUF4345 family protein [Nocardioides limicola]|uniref:DUF4345 family protein n=1 Tax=Nocardioides limicola TaxID=2803368 RepID=UPI00193BC289|nr:DUF4345 family protein [Nocardioides sp. DJM-14]